MREATYKNYLLTVLLLVLAFSFVDRHFLSLVMEDIKRELALSDAQLGLLTGIAFAFFYSIMGIPIARWADRGNRVTIISAAAALCGLMVALAGFVTSFGQLLATRVAVAVGEAGAIPPAHSLIATYFNRTERPRAVAVFMLGGALSVVIGFFLGGWLNQLYGWRTTFMIFGTPGILLAALAWFTLREPRLKRCGAHEEPGAATERAESPESDSGAPTIAAAFLMLWQKRTFRHLLLAFAVVHFFSYGIGQWLPAFFIRSHGFGTAELGMWFALVGLGAAAGIYSGGALASRFAPANERLQLRMMAGVTVLSTFVNILVYTTPDRYVALALMALAAVLSVSVNGPFFGLIQTLVEPRMRAMSIALVYLFANLIGMGLGPLAAGLLSDLLTPVFGSDSLRYALIALCPGYLWTALHFWMAGKSVTIELAPAIQRA